MQQQAGVRGQHASKRANGLVSALFEGSSIGVRALIVALWRRLRARSATQHAQPRDAVSDVPDKPASSANAPEWDAVDEASWESFPASDPPTGWAGRDIKPPTLNGE